MKVEKVDLPAPMKPIKGDRQPGKTAMQKQEGNSEKVKEFTKDKATDPKVLEENVELLNKTMESYKTEIRFSLHEASGEYQVKIINTKDNSVVKELPAESVLNMVAHFKQLLGIVVDKYI